MKDQEVIYRETELILIKKRVIFSSKLEEFEEEESLNLGGVDEI